MCLARLAALVCSATLLGAATLPAQEGEFTRILVVDSLAQPVPYAWVQLNRGVSRTADDSGRVTFNFVAKDSIRIHVRRMGYLPFEGWVSTRIDGSTFMAALALAPKSIAAVRVEERRNTTLARTGFYDRMERIQKGAYTARLYTPEELDMRNPGRISQLLQGEQAVKVTQLNGRAILEGRAGRCGMNVLLDGKLMTGMMEEQISLDRNRALARDLGAVQGDRAAEAKVRTAHAATMTSIDELISAGSVAAIEVYPSPASVPAELQRLIGSSTCGVVALWSGARR